MVILLLSNYSFITTWSVAANSYCWGWQSIGNCPMQRKDIEVLVLLLVYAIKSKPIIWILAIVHICLIIDGMAQNGLNMIVRIKIRSETRLHWCFFCLINGADLLPDYGSILRY